MRIDSLTLQGFRNYQDQTALFHPECNVIVGENAQGKTNLLEALAYLSCGRSPRTRFDRELIGFSEERAVMQAKVFSFERDHLVRAELFRGKRRKLSVNGVTAKNSSAFSEVFNTVFFRPEDLELIREGASARRRFMDIALCQLRPRYEECLSAYNRAYEQKARILKDAEERPELLEVLPEFSRQMVVNGAAVIWYRARFAETLNEIAAVHHAECSGGREQLNITYRTVSSVQDTKISQEQILLLLESHMKAHEAAERASGLCLSGPHKDDLLVTVDGREAKAYCSQGQTRTAALSMKLAERDIYCRSTGEAPVLLLDDVLSELDPKRQEFVLNRIRGGQIFITCCEEDRLPKMVGGSVLKVSSGMFGKES